MVSVKRSTVMTNPLCHAVKINLPRNWPNPSEVFAAGHCVMELCVNPVSRHEGKKSALLISKNFVNIPVLRIAVCHQHNFHGIYACQSVPAVQFAATLVEISRTWWMMKFQDFQGPLRTRGNSGVSTGGTCPPDFRSRGTVMQSPPLFWHTMMR